MLVFIAISMRELLASLLSRRHDVRHVCVDLVQGQCLTCDAEAWIPASIVHVNWHVGRYADDARTSYAMFSGIAAGSNWDAAVAAGLEEVIERDATMSWWLDAIGFRA